MREKIGILGSGDGNISSILSWAESPVSDSRYDGNICYIPFAYHLVPVEGLAKMAAVMRKGELVGKPDEGWREVPPMEQVNHAISHLMAYVAGRHEEHHLANAACRALMALDLDRKERHPVAFPKPKETAESDTNTEGPDPAED